MSGSHRFFRQLRSNPLWFSAASGGSAVLAARQLLNKLEGGTSPTTTYCEAPPQPFTDEAAETPSSNEGEENMTPSIRSKDSDDYPNFSRHGKKATLPKYLSKELYDQLKDKKTPTFGVTLDDIIQAGTSLPWGADPPRGVGGVYAGDAGCYTTFAPFLEPMIEEYHGVQLVKGSNNQRRPSRFIRSYHSKPLNAQKEEMQKEEMRDKFAMKLSHRKRSKLQRHETNLDPNRLLDKPVDPTGEYILYTRMRLARNIRGFAFAPSIARRDRKRLERLFQAICQEDFQPLQGGEYISIMDLTNEKHEDYMSHRLCFLDPDEFKIAARLGRDWPDGRGLYFSHWNPMSFFKMKQQGTTKTTTSKGKDWNESPPNLLMWFNYDDHVWVISVSKGGNVQEVFACLSDAVRQLELSLLERSMGFAIDPRLGFLTASPTNVGTALRASMSVKLVKLGKQHPQLFQEILHRLHLESKSEYAETDLRYTGIFDIANAERLGRTEVQWINIMISGVSKLIELEKKLERGETVTLQDVDDIVKGVKGEA
jgi:hypothetical protein